MGNIFANNNIGEMISHGRKAFACNVMQTNQGPDRLCQVKSHVQTVCESHDLNMDFCGFKQLRLTNSYAKISYRITLLSRLTVIYANSEDPDEMQLQLRLKQPFGTESHHNLENSTYDPLKYIMGSPIELYYQAWENPSE